MRQVERIIPNDTEPLKEPKDEDPLGTLAECIAQSLGVEHCAIEYTTASGTHRWVGSEQAEWAGEAVLKIPGMDGKHDRGAVLEASQHRWQFLGAAVCCAERRIGFLISTPLFLKSGTLIGRIWLADRNARALHPSEHDRLADLARVASEMIYQRGRLSRATDAESMSKTGMWNWRASSGLVFGSPQFWAIFGIDDQREGVPPSALLRRIPKPDRIRIVRAFKKAIRMSQPLTLELQIAGGRHGVTDAVATMRIDADLTGRLVGSFGIFQDISDRKQAEQLGSQNRSLTESLRIAQDLADQQRSFVSMVAHEIRTPLAIIDGHAHRLQRVPAHSASGGSPDAANKIRSSVKRLTGVIDKVLCAARFEAGRTPYAPAWLDLAGLLEDICESQLEIMPSRRIEQDFDRLQDKIFGDRKLLDHVFTNLISNALKYSPESEQIWVSARQDDDGVEISVRDQGVGIPEDELASIYERFFRARTSTGIVGTGYGLHIVKQFIELHHGRIDLTSREGEGSTFSVRLPRQAPNPDA